MLLQNEFPSQATGSRTLLRLEPKHINRYTRTASVRRLEQMDKETYGALREHHRVPQARFYYRIEPLVTTYTIITKRSASRQHRPRVLGERWCSCISREHFFDGRTG